MNIELNLARVWRLICVIAVTEQLNTFVQRHTNAYCVAFNVSMFAYIDCFTWGTDWIAFTFEDINNSKRFRTIIALSYVGGNIAFRIMSAHKRLQVTWNILVDWTPVTSWFNWHFHIAIRLGQFGEEMYIPEKRIKKTLIKGMVYQISQYVCIKSS